MLAARLTAPFTFEYPDLPVPQPGKGQVLLQNLCLGVCASDIQIYHGKHSYAAFPLVMGHEAACRVIAVGEGVTAFAPGDRVVPEPQIVCGKCLPCERGRFNVCRELKVLGVHTDGCACEYISVDEWNFHRAPEGLTDELAALTEPAAVGTGCVARAGDLRGKNVTVVGAGSIGNLTAQCAKAAGAQKVLITDIIPEKLKIAESCGIDCCVNTRDILLSDAINSTFGEHIQSDVIIDCAATAGSFESILSAARNSSVVVISGNFKEPVSFDVPLLQRREISLLGHMMYVREDFALAAKLLTDGTIITDGLISGRYPLSEYHRAFEEIDANPASAMKMLVHIA